MTGGADALDAVDAVAALARVLQGRHRLETLLEHVVDTASRVTRTPRASLRLLDPTGTRLLAVARAGQPLHLDASYEFHRDEGFLGWIVSHGQPIRSDHPADDPRFSARPDIKVPMGSFLGVPVVSGAVSLGVLAAVADAPAHFTDYDESLMVLLAAMSAPHLEVSRLARLARLDPLTGALNRRTLDDGAPPPARDPLTVLYADLDRFRELNDRHGHAGGDEILREVTRVISALIRRDDAVVRWGGDQLVVMLPAVELATAARIAERARRGVADTAIPIGDDLVRATVSIGVAERRPGEQLEAAIERAAAAAAVAKRAGRDQVSLAPPATPTPGRP